MHLRHFYFENRFYFPAKIDEFEIESEINDENFDRNFEILLGF